MQLRLPAAVSGMYGEQAHGDSTQRHEGHLGGSEAPGEPPQRRDSCEKLNADLECYGQLADPKADVLRERLVFLKDLRTCICESNMCLTQCARILKMFAFPTNLISPESRIGV